MSALQAAFREAMRQQEAQTQKALQQVADFQLQAKAEQEAYARQHDELSEQRALLQEQAAEQAAQLQRQDARFKSLQAQVCFLHILETEHGSEGCQLIDGISTAASWTLEGNVELGPVLETFFESLCCQQFFACVFFCCHIEASLL